MLTNKKMQSGQSLVETMLTLPIVLLIMFGTIEFGRGLITMSQVVNQTRAALRYGVGVGYGTEGNYLDCTAMESIAGDVFFASDYAVTISHDLLDGNPPQACNVSSESDIDGGDLLVIESTGEFRSVIPFFSFNIPLNYRGQRTIPKQIGLSVVDNGSDDGDEIVPDVDLDGDGMDDDWEIAEFGNTTPGPTDDPDSDDCDNLCEFRLGLDPQVNDVPSLLMAPPAFDWPEAKCNAASSNSYIGLKWSALSPGIVGSNLIDSIRLHADHGSGYEVVGEFNTSTTSCGGGIGGSTGCFNKGVASSQWYSWAKDPITYKIQPYDELLESEAVRMGFAADHFYPLASATPLTLTCDANIYKVSNLQWNTPPPTSCNGKGFQMDWDDVHDATEYRIYVDGYAGNPIATVTSSDCNGNACVSNVGSMGSLPSPTRRFYVIPYHNAMPGLAPATYLEQTCS